MSSNSQKIIVAENTSSIIGFNYGVQTIENILGVSLSGWGLPLTLSNSISPAANRVGATQWNQLLADVEIVNLHIYNTTTGITPFATGTVITGELLDKIDELDSLRYTCHPSQFQISTLTSTTNYVSSSSVSIRTTTWGITTSSIQHQWIVGFNDYISANYYFNQGNYLTWKPYYLVSLSTITNTGTSLTSRIINDLDGEWANFIDYINSSTAYHYDRDKFVNYTSTITSWISGTLHIELSATVEEPGNLISFEANYYNDDSANLVISPTVGLYPVSVPAP